MAVRHPGPEKVTVPEALVPELGMRRVRWVRISVSDDGVRAEVAGLGHRFPIVRPVTLKVANRLIRAGCPYIIRGNTPAAAGAGG